MKIDSGYLKAAGLAIGMSAGSAPVGAQMFDAVRLYGAGPGKDGGTVGLAVVSGREYQGSDERRNMLVPLLDYQWRSGWFAGTTNGIGFNFSARPDINYGLRATVDFGRNEDRSAALRGVGDVDARPEFGAFFNYAVAPSIVLTSSLRYGAGNDRKGLLLDVGAVYSLDLSPAWRLAIGVAATYANAEYTQSYFGVDALQSARSGYLAYAPGAGLRDARANLSLSYRLNPAWALTGAVSVTSLQGDAKGSPLVRERSSANAVAAISHAF